MDWLVGTSKQGLHTKLLMCSHDGQIDSVDAASLAMHGLPKSKKTERLVFTGEISEWSRTSGEKYLKALRIRLPQSQANAHSVYVHKLDNGTNLHVPALALIRAFFKPHKLSLPVLFTQAGIDLLGFVDFSAEPPSVVLDSNPGRYARCADGDSLCEPLRWAHTSHSGKNCARSIYVNGASGRIELDLPQGEFRLVMHGVRKGRELFVTKVTVISINVVAQDSITGSDESFTFHRLASKDRKVKVLKDFPLIPLREDQQVALTDAEWQRVKGLVTNKRSRSMRYCRRQLLDLMLEKLSSKRSWEVMAQRSGIPEFSLTTTFRRWGLEGRFTKVLDELTQMRLDAGSRPV